MKFNIFELGIFSFNSYVYYLTRGFIASTRAFNLLIRAFNLPTRVFSVPTHAINLCNSNSCFTFPPPKDVAQNLKDEIEFIMKSNESLAENKIKNEI